jgi:general secretion pathway protein D
MGVFGNPTGGYAYGNQSVAGVSAAPISTPASGNANPPQAANDLTGSYLGAAQANAGANRTGPTVIPNPFDNTLLVRGTSQEWEQIKNLLRQIDVPPRQVLIDAKIYEVDLTGALSSGVTAYLQKRSGANKSLAASSAAVTQAGGGLGISLGALVLQSHEVLLALSAAETTSKSRLISSPSIIATDSVPAIMNVGQDVPVLTSQAITGGVQQGGTNLFTNTVSNRSSGVTLSLMARVNSSGVVTMMIDQDVSKPEAPSAGGIQSPSFTRRSFSTQVTVQDGDTIAIGGFIQESTGTSSSGVPFLHRLPVLGAAFGGKSMNKARTELVIFLTPRVIYDTNQVIDATDEIKSNLKKLRSSIKEEQ